MDYQAKVDVMDQKSVDGFLAISQASALSDASETHFTYMRTSSVDQSSGRQKEASCWIVVVQIC